MAELSVIIPARQEEWLVRTVEDVLTHSTADTEVIAVLDGAWPNPGLAQHPKLTVLYVPEPIGQRAAYNLGARISTATYVAKLDAHCSVSHGWDRVLIDSAQDLEANTIQIPAQKNFHIYNQVCVGCGASYDQAPMRPSCPKCQGTEWRKEVVWQPRNRPTSTNWVFKSDLVFTYTSDKQQQGDYPEVMSCLGACWFMSRAYHHHLGGLDEGHGSWGQVGTELACKTWLSGGRLVCNRKAWFAHFFRVGGIGFPYPIKHSDQEKARAYSRSLWRGNRWPLQQYPLRWLVEKFAPVKGWSQAEIDALPDLPIIRHNICHGNTVEYGLRKGCIYYSDNRGDEAILVACRDQLDRVRPGPVEAVTLGRVSVPSGGWHPIVLDLERGYLTMFRQILAGLEASDADIVFLTEHDVLYHASHFEFVPPDPTRVYYNVNVWKVDAASGRALHYDCQQTSGLCAYRDVLLQHYRRRVALVESTGYSRRQGFEPGTHRRSERVDDLTADSWRSEYPNIDIRHGSNLTPSRWRKEDFRNQKYTAGWVEGDGVPGWGTTRGRFQDFLREIGRDTQQAVA